MTIAVCVNHVPDTVSKISIAGDVKSADKNGLTFTLNPYDEYAVEEALKIKESKDAEVVVISLGDDSNKDSIRKTLAMGADRGVLLRPGHNNLDSLSVAKALSEEIKNQNCEIVFCGKQSVDYDNSVVGQLISEILDFNSVTVAVDLKIEGEKVTGEREIEGGVEVVETSLPVVVTAQKGLNEPRYASLKGIMSAKRKPIEEKNITAAESKTEILEMRLPPQKSAGRILGSDSNSVVELVKLLKEEAKVI